MPRVSNAYSLGLQLACVRVGRGGSSSRARVTGRNPKKLRSFSGSLGIGCHLEGKTRSESTDFGLCLCRSSRHSLIAI